MNMTEKTASLRNGLFCCLVFLGCYLLAWPVAQIAYGDDWSYMETARVFAQTGHFAYNGWSAAMLGWMIPWGALFIHLFGFSFMTVKLSTLPIALATLLLFHAVLRRFEIGPRSAVIGTLILGLSPLFLPMSASFLSDIPGLLVIVLCLYLCQRALAASTDGAAIGWLATAAATNVIGGTARQIAWLGVLVMVPCTGWLLRRRRRVFAAAGVFWLAGIGVVFYAMHWFAQQPYSIPTALLPDASWSLRSVLAVGISAVDYLSAEMLFLLFLSFPVLVAWLPKLSLNRSTARYVKLFCWAVLPLLLTRLLVGPFASIWPPNVVFLRLAILEHFFRSGGDVLLLVMCSFVLAGAYGCVVAVRGKFSEIVAADPAGARNLLWLLAPFSFCYFALLLPIIWQGTIFNKCMLGMMPCAIIATIWLYERFAGSQLPGLSVGVLILFGLLSIAGTHDRFAWQRARLAAIHELRSTGVARTSIEAGFEYDGWTQVEGGNYVNEPRIRIPKGAYHPPPVRSAHYKACNEWFLDRLSDIHPAYFIGKGPAGCFVPSGFPAVHYTVWLPPFHRVVEVQRVPGS